MRGHPLHPLPARPGVPQKRRSPPGAFPPLYPPRPCPLLAVPGPAPGDFGHSVLPRTGPPVNSPGGCRRLSHGYPHPSDSVGRQNFFADHMPKETCQEWRVYRRMSHGRIWDYVSRGLRAYEVASFETLARLYIRRKLVEPLAGKELVSQKHGKGSRYSVSRGETFARSFRIPT